MNDILKENIIFWSREMYPPKVNSKEPLFKSTQLENFEFCFRFLLVNNLSSQDLLSSWSFLLCSDFKCCSIFKSFSLRLIKQLYNAQCHLWVINTTLGVCNYLKKNHIKSLKQSSHLKLLPNFLY